ncbi:hypothetical protein GCK32_009132 [Trichostrongylus colubriformis]|uniref:Uncharacterized protein n=1 Tax=Trichostrongylus colubriformis TaxID=6319 RepID=A0AAN8G4K2_TRICO
MYLVVFLCFLGRVQGFFTFLLDDPWWPAGSDSLLDEMAKEITGYYVNDMQRVQPDMRATQRKHNESRVFWEKIDKIRQFSPSYNASLAVLGTLAALASKGSTRGFAKTRIADTWDGLIHEEQAQWKKDFSWVAYAEKLSNIRRRNSKFCFGLCSELREGSFCWYQLTQDHVSYQAPEKRL